MRAPTPARSRRRETRFSGFARNLNSCLRKSGILDRPRERQFRIQARRPRRGCTTAKAARRGNYWGGAAGARLAAGGAGAAGAGATGVVVAGTAGAVSVGFVSGVAGDAAAAAAGAGS